MAESAVSFLVQNLDTLLIEEVKLLTGIREEVVYVRDELERMRAFLRVADAVEDDDEEIKVWVKQVREVAFDTEDIIDDFLYRFEENRRLGFYGYLCKIARKIKNLKHHHQIASEIHGIKSRLINVSERRPKNGYGFKIMEQGSSSSNVASNVWWDSRSDALFLGKDELVGIDNPKKELVSLLQLEDTTSLPKVVAVVGMGGLGKTTLVNQVYNDTQVKKYFQHHAWITVSQSFTPSNLLRSIIQQLFEGIKQPIPQEAYSSYSFHLFDIIHDFLSEKRYLVVTDDIWSVDAWHSLKLAFPHNNYGSRIMLTTRNVDVASVATEDFFKGNIHHLKPLSFEQSWNLFCARTFQGHSCPPYLEEISQRILKRCMGLPLAIVIISGVLSVKDTSKLNEWEMVDRIVGRGEFGINYELKNLKTILSLSFNDLPWYLKYCFLSLSIFPEDWIYSRSYITSLWIAEGFVKETEGKSPKVVANAYFNELLLRSLIQLAKENHDENSSQYRVHDLIREIIRSISKAQNFATTLGEENPTLRENLRHLSMHKTTTIENLRGDNDLSRLRTLVFLHSKDSTPTISMEEFFKGKGGLRLLKVLDCGSLPLNVFPECITKLYNLKYLNLNSTNVASIPRSIGRLRNLEELNLGETFVEELPAEILQLHRLRDIIVYHSIHDHGSPFKRHIGCKVPTRIGTLTSLRTLDLIRASGGRHVDLIRSLENLKQLEWLGIQELRADHGPALCSLIRKLSHLHYLRMETRGEDEILDVQDVSSPPQQLQQLFMYVRLEMLPRWVSELSSLETLVLRWSKLQVDPLESLQALPNLVQLSFEKVYDGEALCFKAGGFQKLKNFTCVNLGRLRQVIVEQGATPLLQELRLQDCKLLEEVPLGLEFLSNLKEIYFINMGDQLVRRLRWRNQHPDFLRVKHVPYVHIGTRDVDGTFSRDFI